MRQSLDRFSHSAGGGRPRPGPDIATRLRTVQGVFPDGGDGQAIVIAVSQGTVQSKTISTTATDELGRVPADGDVHHVELTALGDYRAQAQRVGGGTVVTALPSEEVDDILSSLIWWEVFAGTARGRCGRRRRHRSSYAASCAL